MTGSSAHVGKLIFGNYKEENVKKLFPVYDGTSWNNGKYKNQVLTKRISTLKEWKSYLIQLYEDTENTSTLLNENQKIFLQAFNSLDDDFLYSQLFRFTGGNIRYLIDFFGYGGTYVETLKQSEKKDEKKSLIYDYLSGFIEKCYVDFKKRSLISTKS